MKRVALVAVLMGFTGCSNAPIAGLMDCVVPSKPAGPPKPPPLPPPLPPGERLPAPDLGIPVGPPPRP